MSFLIFFIFFHQFDQKNDQFSIFVFFQSRSWFFWSIFIFMSSLSRWLISMIQCIVIFFTICCLLYWLNFLWKKIIDERLFTRWWWEISMFRFDAWCNEKHKNKSQYLQDFFDSEFTTKTYESFDLRKDRIMLHEQCFESCSCFHVSNNDSKKKNNRHNFSQRHFVVIQNTNSYSLYFFFFRHDFAMIAILHSLQNFSRDILLTSLISFRFCLFVSTSHISFLSFAISLKLIRLYEFRFDVYFFISSFVLI